MSFILSTIQQIRFPAEGGAQGRFQVIINRPGTSGIDIAATDTLLLSQGVSPFLFGEIPISKKLQSKRGRRALDNITLTIRDTLVYEGTVNGVPVSEDLSTAYQTFCDVWFDDTAHYETLILWRNTDPDYTECCFMGFIDPTFKPSNNPNILNPGTLQQIWLGDRSTKVIEGGNVLSKTFQSVLNLIRDSDCVYGTPYHGFMWAPPGCDGKRDTRDGAFSSTKGGWYLAVPHIHTHQPSDDPILRRIDAPVWPSSPFVSAMQFGVAHVKVVSGGSGYNIGDVVTIDTGSSLARLRVVKVTVGTGIVAGVGPLRVIKPGGGYAAGTTYATTAITGGGTGLTVNVTELNARGVWGPSGLVFISIGTLFTKIAEAMELETPFVPSTDLQSAVDWFCQKAGVNNDFPIDSASPVPVDELYINLNVLVKSHPMDGTYWDNPIGWSPTTLISDVLNGLCSLLLCDFEIDALYDMTHNGTGALVTRAMGTNTATLPAGWVNEGAPAQEDPNIGPRSVTVKNRADSLEIQCPFGVPGDSNKIEIPFRIHRIARTSHEVSGGNWDKAAVIYDDSKTYDQQSDECFKVAWVDEHGNQVPNDTCWKSLCHVYWFNASNTNVVYPSTWDGFANNDGTVGDWANSFYVVNAIYKAGDTPPADLQAVFHGDDFFNTRCYHSVAFAVLSTALDSVQSFNYVGVADSTGSVQVVGTGMHATWLLSGFSQKWRAMEVTQNLRGGKTLVKWQAIDGTDAFPEINDKDYGPIGGGGTTTSTGGSSVGGGITPPASSVSWHPLSVVHVIGAGVVGLPGYDNAYLCEDATTTGVTAPTVDAPKMIVVTNKSGADWSAGDFYVPDNGTWALYFDGTATQSDPTLPNGWNVFGRSS